MAVAAELDPDKVYVCSVPFLAGDPPAATQEGEQLKGNDPRVQAAPGYFYELGAPESERPTPFDHVVSINEQNARSVEEERKAAFERAAKANAVKIEPPKMVKAKRDIVGELDGQPATVKRGSVLPSDHPFVVEHEDSFA